MFTKVSTKDLHEMTASFAIVISMCEQGAYNLAQINDAKSKLEKMKSVLIDPASILEDSSETTAENPATDKE